MKTPSTDNSLVRKVKKSNCNDSLLELTARHSPLFFSIANRYTAKFYFSGINLQDVYDEKLNVIYLAATTYKPGKSKFSTWLANCARFFCLKLITKHTRLNSNLSHQEIEWAKIPDLTIKNNDTHFYLKDLLGQIQDERIQKIFQLRYFSGKKNNNWLKIGKKVNLSRQQALNLHNKTIKMLKSKLTSNTICDSI